MSDSWQDVDDSHSRVQGNANSDDDMGDEQFRDSGAEFVHGIREMESLGLVDIGALAAWSVSSSKAGSGIKELREDNPLTFWQSDGTQPHNLDIHFSKRVTVSRISFFTDFPLDESYTPSKITVYAGNGFHDLINVVTLNLHEPSGWHHIVLNEMEGLRGGLRAFLIRILVEANHQHGKDTHLRAVKIYSPMTQYAIDTSALGSFTSRKMIACSTIR